MRTYIRTISLLALAASFSYGEEAPEKPEKGKGIPEAMFKKLDTDSDESLSLEEFKASPRGKKDPEKAEEAFKKLDADSDDSLSLEEFKAALPDKGKKGGKKKKDEASEE